MLWEEYDLYGERAREAQRSFEITRMGLSEARRHAAFLRGFAPRIRHMWIVELRNGKMEKVELII